MQSLDEATPVTPAIAHETKIDHAEIIIDVSRFIRSLSNPPHAIPTAVYEGLRVLQRPSRESHDPLHRFPDRTGALRSWESRDGSQVRYPL